MARTDLHVYTQKAVRYMVNLDCLQTFSSDRVNEGTYYLVMLQVAVNEGTYYLVMLQVATPDTTTPQPPTSLH